jgi:hypothetical protein
LSECRQQHGSRSPGKSGAAAGELPKGSVIL